MASLPQFERKGIRSSATQSGNTEAVSGLKDKYFSQALRLRRYKMLVARAVDALGDEIKASRWLSVPNPDLNGQTPLQVAERDGYGLDAIEPLLTRIEHGVYY
ncbi:MAG: MbcA/ParS/Xre antitoxin family protein [Terracidiphilus sp.]|jgi:uncharacterized protein (DUF2384 family)